MLFCAGITGKDCSRRDSMDRTLTMSMLDYFFLSGMQGETIYLRGYAFCQAENMSAYHGCLCAV